MNKHKRSGDHSFHPLEKVPTGEEITHNGSFTFGVGEASNHNHVITVEKPNEKEI